MLPEFRAKVADAGLEQVPLDALLERLSADGLVKAGGKQRTDSTHVVAAVAELNQLELAGESVRAAVEALTAAHPGWVAAALHVSEWTRKYGTPVPGWHLPASKKKQDELAVTYAKDGYALLRAVYHRVSRKVFSAGHEGVPRPRMAISRAVSCLILRMVAAILV